MNNYTLYTVGDCCVTMQVGHHINEEWSEKVIAMQRWFGSHSFIGLNDVIIAYNSISLQYNPLQVKQYYRPAGTISTFVKELLLQAYDQAIPSSDARALVRIPVCYEGEYGPDLEWVARFAHLDAEEVIRLHTETIYRVYMIGFLPGFPYMAAVPDAIAVPRKKGPAPVAAGSIGLAGVQTGIYPLASPGGWQIIGRTPLRLFTPYAEERPLIRAGDHVQFYRIVKEEFISRIE